MKNNNNTYIYIILLACLFILQACADSYMGLEQMKTDSTKPGKITVNKVIPKSGSLEIHFSLPKGDPDIAQVIASYINTQGEKIEFKVSRYSSSILVEGFLGTDEVTVELLTVDNSGNESEITYVKDKPLISPLELALNALKAEPAFGGVKVEWQNLGGDFLAIHVLTEVMEQKNVLSLEENQSHLIYSRDSVNTYSYIRPYIDKPQKFGFIVSDKWGNRSDTLIKILTPFREDRVDYKPVEQLNWFNFTVNRGGLDYDRYGVDPITGIQNDGIFHENSMTPRTIFDGIYTGNQMYCYKFIKNLDDGDASTDTLVQSAYATFDLKVDVRLSRCKLFTRPNNAYYSKISSIRTFRIWGTNDENEHRITKFPETWTLIGEYVGRDAEDPDNLSLDDIEYYSGGQEFSIEGDNVNTKASPMETIRYLRFEMVESYGAHEFNYILNELELYGQIEKKYY